MQLTDVHLYVISFVAMVVIWVVKFVTDRAGKPIPRGWLTTGVYVVSFGLALAFQLPALPPFGPVSDPVSFVNACLQWLSEFLVNIGPFVGFATLIYNVLFKKVLDGLGYKISRKLDAVG